ncbi:MAG: flagellin [Sneathiella sp.]|uniref:flagellin n=1 Tax=Sneathiella sp. TaxID=1964365 RepID=UPI0030030568
MTRISTAQQSQMRITDMMNSQKQVADAQRQVTTGHVAEFYKDIHMDVTSLAGAKSLLARLDQHEANNSLILNRLSSYDQAMAGIESSGNDIRGAVMSAINTASTQGLYATVEGAFENVLNFLNSQNTEGYLFAGTNRDVAPVNISSINDLLLAAEPPTDIFQNNDLKSAVRIDENRTLEVGVLAEDLGLEIMTAFQRMAMWQNGIVPTTTPVPTGPSGNFTTPLSSEDQDFLIGEIANIEQLVNNISAFRGDNGLNQKTIEEAQEVLSLQINQAKGLVSGIEDVDSAEAITNLNQKNFALEASYNVLSQINRLSLLNFI